MRPAVFAVNREAGDLKFEQDFRNLVRDSQQVRPLVVKTAESRTTMGKEVERLGRRAGTFGDGDDAAGTIQFTFERGRPGRRTPTLRMSQVSGMIFNQKAGARPAGHLQGDRHGGQRAGGPGRHAGRQGLRDHDRLRA